MHFQLSRRAFLRSGTLFLAASSVEPCSSFGDDDNTALRVGLVTDMHYADKNPAGTRYYRETLDKLAEAAGKFENEKLDFLVELGDFIDAAGSVDDELRYLKTINGEFAPIAKERHYVLGNHCVDTLTKEEFLGGIEREKSYYSFDRNGTHFVVLDSCFRSDGTPYGRKNFQWTDANVSAEELEWLKADLSEATANVIVFAHQRLDVANNHGVKNAPAVRTILEESGKVLAVFQGHSHQNDLKEIAGIHYCTLVAMVEGSGAENNGYSMMEISPNGTIAVRGFRKQKNYEWMPQA